MGRNQFLNKHQFIRMSKDELERKWKAHRLIEQEEMLLMEAKAKALQYIASSSAAGGSVPQAEPEEAIFDVGAVLFLDSTWKYLYLDYENGVISDPIDTGISDSYQYFLKGLSGPVQDKGLVYVVSEVLDPYSEVNPFNISIIYIGVNGELIETKSITADPDNLFLTNVDGIAHTFIEGTGLISTLSIFNGSEMISNEYQNIQGYDGFNIIPGGSVGGRIILYVLFYSGESIPLVKILSLDPKNGEEIEIYSGDLFSMGDPEGRAYYSGDILYMIFYDFETGLLSRIIGWNVNSGINVFDEDIVSGVTGPILGNSELIFYGMNSMQIIVTYDVESVEHAKIYNFDGTNKIVTKQEVEGFSEFDDVVIRRSSFDPYTIHTYTESEGIANIFYSGTPSDGIMTVPDLCSIYYHLKGEESYRTYVIRESGDPERSINLNYGQNLLSIGKDLYIEADLGDPSGLSGGLSIVNLGETIKIIEEIADTSIMEGLSLFPSGDNSLYVIAQESLYKILLLGPGGEIISAILDSLDKLRISGESGFLQGLSGQYYWNSQSSGLQELSNYPGAIESEYATLDRKSDGNLIVYNSETSPVNYFILSKNSVGDVIQLDLEAPGEFILGKSTIMYRITDTDNKFFIFDFQGNLLQSYDEPEEYVGISEFYLTGNKFLAVRRNTEENNADIFMGSSTGISKNTVNGFNFQILPMLNDLIWFDQYTYPEPPTVSLQIDSVNNTVSSDSMEFSYASLRTNPGDVIEIRIGPDMNTLAAESVYDTIPVVSDQGSETYNFYSGGSFDDLVGNYIGLFAIDYAGNGISSDAFQIPNSSSGVYLVTAFTSNNSKTIYTYRLAGGNGNNTYSIYGSSDVGSTYFKIDGFTGINSADGVFSVKLSDLDDNGNSLSGLNLLLKVIVIVDLGGGVSLEMESTNTTGRIYP